MFDYHPEDPMNSSPHMQFQRAWAMKLAIECAAYIPSPKTMEEIARFTVIIERFIRTGELKDGSTIYIRKEKQFTPGG